jgi:hypothetical protein
MPKHLQRTWIGKVVGEAGGAAGTAPDAVADKNVRWWRRRAA